MIQTNTLAVMFQSTPAHGGRLEKIAVLRITHGVSIHARTRRATPHLRMFVVIQFVSIHARTRRATSRIGPNSSTDSVSIHARTRRATQSKPDSGGIHFRFNPRPHTAGDIADGKVFC